MPSATPTAAEPPPKARTGRAADIRATLQEEIESGQLPPGALLDERALAARFEVSRTPVREALQQLAVGALVRINPRQGVQVARISIGRLRATLEAITETECVVVRLAARRLDTDLRSALESALARCEAAASQGGAGEYALANAVFHEAIYAGCRNAVLCEQLRVLRRRVHRYRVRDFQTQPMIDRSLVEHRRIAAAVLAGDEDAAAAAMREHLPLGHAGFGEFLATVPTSFFEPDVD